MKNKNNKANMKKFMKMAFAVVAFAAVGLGSYKAYGSYTAANMSEEDLLIAENVEALSQSKEGQGYYTNCTISNPRCEYDVTGPAGKRRFVKPVNLPYSMEIEGEYLTFNKYGHADFVYTGTNCYAGGQSECLPKPCLATFNVTVYPY